MTYNNPSSGRCNLSDYCYRFSNLKVNKNKKKGGCAPHQPVLLLSVINLIWSGEITDTRIYPSDSLVQKYGFYWQLFNITTYEENISLPFYHLKNHKERFWRIHFSSGYDGGRPSTINRLREDVDYAQIDDELFQLIRIQETCKELIDCLVISWFYCQEDIESYLDLARQNIFTNFVLSSNKDFKNQKNTRDFWVRDSMFRQAILHLYGCRCALCYLKTELGNLNVVEGAHIKPFSKFFDNRIVNGIALCKNHHWAFDRGLFSLDVDYTTMVSTEFTEISPLNKPLKEFAECKIHLPSKSIHYPDQKSLKWHRNNVFLG